MTRSIKSFSSGVIGDAVRRGFGRNVTSLCNVVIFLSRGPHCSPLAENVIGHGAGSFTLCDGEPDVRNELGIWRGAVVRRVESRHVAITQFTLPLQSCFQGRNFPLILEEVLE